MLQLDRLVLAEPSFRLVADFIVPQGAKVAIIGPSGAGKSSLLNAIAGFVVPTEGRILWQGVDLAPLDPGSLPITILFQDQNLFPHLTVAQNLALGLSSQLRPSAQDVQRINWALTRTGLAGLGDRRPSELSGGQVGRAALARALLRARPILLLDEPFSALGPALKAEMLALVAEVADETGATVLMVTHDPKDAQGFAALTVLVADGLAQSPVNTASLFANPPKALADYLG